MTQRKKECLELKEWYVGQWPWDPALFYEKWLAENVWTLPRTGGNRSSSKKEGSESGPTSLTGLTLTTAEFKKQNKKSRKQPFIMK